MSVYDPVEWSDSGLALVGAAATLAVLIFVAISTRSCPDLKESRRVPAARSS